MMKSLLLENRHTGEVKGLKAIKCTRIYVRQNNLRVHGARKGMRRSRTGHTILDEVAYSFLFSFPVGGKLLYEIKKIPGNSMNTSSVVGKQQTQRL